MGKKVNMVAHDLNLSQSVLMILNHEERIRKTVKGSESIWSTVITSD